LRFRKNWIRRRGLRPTISPTIKHRKALRSRTAVIAFSPSFSCFSYVLALQHADIVRWTQTLHWRGSTESRKKTSFTVFFLSSFSFLCRKVCSQLLSSSSRRLCLHCINSSGWSVEKSRMWSPSFLASPFQSRQPRLEMSFWRWVHSFACK
jgi:hypothetical protein